MTGPQHGADIDAVIREMRELAREPYQPVDEVVAPRSTHYIMWLFAALGATYCG